MLQKLCISEPDTILFEQLIHVCIYKELIVNMSWHDVDDDATISKKNNALLFVFLEALAFLLFLQWRLQITWQIESSRGS